MYGDLKQVIEEEKDFLPSQFKIIDRCEPSITSIDEKKQLRMVQLYNYTPIKYRNDSIYFAQHQGKVMFSLQELKELSNFLKRCIEMCLNYEIDEPIFMFDSREI